MIANPLVVGLLAVGVPAVLLLAVIAWAFATDEAWAAPPDCPDEVEAP